ncbi:hypothetical protein D3C81_456980 [compost metagenome]
MIDYRLKAADSLALENALLESGAAEWTAGQLIPVEGVALDIIGVWSECVEVDGEVLCTPVPGYHANVRAAAPISWPEGVELMESATPWRIWA